MAEENGARCYSSSLDRGFNVALLQISLFQVPGAHAAGAADRCRFRARMSTRLICAAVREISQLPRETPRLWA